MARMHRLYRLIRSIGRIPVGRLRLLLHDHRKKEKKRKEKKKDETKFLNDEIDKWYKKDKGNKENYVRSPSGTS